MKGIVKYTDSQQRACFKRQVLYVNNTQSAREDAGPGAKAQVALK